MPQRDNVAGLINCDAVSDYYLLLRAALEASDVTDAFDLQSDQPDSVEMFRDLERQSAEAQLALMDHIQRNRTTLRETFLTFSNLEGVKK